MKKIIFITLFIYQFSHSQTNLLSNSKQDFIYDNTIKKFKPISAVKEVLNSFLFIKEPALLIISEVSVTPITENKYTIISVEDDKVNDLINFEIKDENNLEYLLMLSTKQQQIILIYEENNLHFFTDFRLVSTI